MKRYEEADIITNYTDKGEHYNQVMNSIDLVERDVQTPEEKVAILCHLYSKYYYMLLTETDDKIFKDLSEAVDMLRIAFTHKCMVANQYYVDFSKETPIWRKIGEER